MSKVEIDADALDLFVSQLITFNKTLSDQKSRLRAQFLRLGETWKDPYFMKFSQEFDQTMKNLNRFHRESDDVIPKLRKKAQRARDVHL